jgi:hypothetical protein
MNKYFLFSYFFYFIALRCYKIKVKNMIDPTKKRIGDWLVTAFEGGSNYWYTITEKINPEKITFIMEKGELKTPLTLPTNKEELKKFKKETYYHGIYDCILNGGILFISDVDDGYVKETLSLDKIYASLELIKKERPEIWRRLINDRYDAGDADIFLQMVLFKEIVYS